MAQTSAMNSERLVEMKDVPKTERDIVKTELEVTVKLEAFECLVCCSRTRECFDIYMTNTAASGATLHNFIAKYTQIDIAYSDSCSKYLCKSCYDLINILEQAEVEYMKLKEAFETIISKNPIFEQAVVPQPIGLSSVKNEINLPRIEEDSEDEPLANQKKVHNSKTVKKKRKTTSKVKQKKSIEKNIIESNSWACDECDANGDTGGPIALAAHKLTIHTLADATTIKTEEGSQSPFNNGIDDTMELTFDGFDDDDDSNFNPDEFTNGQEKKKIKKRIPSKRPKVMHQCDQCSARYSSLVRLEAHKQKHDGSKPPYICEVCGAHYKHKRACDIHIALHKGISDWKCEECNKLFPSKNALARHNNIHTGKLNYQCDLCGKSFIHTSSFKMHKLTHSGVKPHACDVCGLALMTRSHLKRHKRIHSGEKRHECTVCGKRFSERYNLAAHQKAHEAAGGGAGAGAGGAAPAEPRRRLFRCHFCVDRFERRYMLERHMSAVHGRTLERPPATPRNTMSKLLKQRAHPHAHAHAHAHAADSPAPKDERSPEPRAPAAPTSAAPAPTSTPSKLLAHLTSSSSIITTGSWSGAYAAEFGLRGDFPH